MRVLIAHGYLLRGTGSNVYTASLAAALVALGHEVALVCQERAADELPFVDAVGDWDAGKLRVRAHRRPVRCTVYRPDIGGLLPVYVADRYEDVEARLLPELSDAELERYLAANVAAVAAVVATERPEVALANHLVMAPTVLARALDGRGVPYAVKVHGSALEYTVRPHPDRFLPYAREGLAPARGVLVGSGHVARRLWALLGDPTLPARTRLGPPGVDVRAFAPRPRSAARAGLARLAARLSSIAPVRTPTAFGSPSAAPRPTASASGFGREPAAAGAALGALAAAHEAGDPLVAYVGKLLVAKGVDLLIAAWPLVLARVPRARLAVVGFGAYRDGLERLRGALAAGDLAAARELATAGRTIEGGPSGVLHHLAAFLDGLHGGARDEYVRAAAALDGRVVFCGRLEHDELGELLPACEAQAVPSTFPEAFGMVAAEAAACGALPVSAAHSGLAEVSGVLAAAVPEPARAWLSFPLDDRAIPALARRLVDWLEAPDDLRAATRAALVATARERWSWERVGEGVIAAAEGRLDGLAAP